MMTLGSLQENTNLAIESFKRLWRNCL